MRLQLTTHVGGHYEAVMAGFDHKLFGQLAPPFPKVRLQRFDGSGVDDEVHLELDFVLFKQVWHSRIVEAGTTPTEAFFVDEGIRLPFFLKQWRHRHRVVATGPNECQIIDAIEYSTGSWLTNVLFYPALWAQFAYRVPVYRRVFGRPRRG
jgi:ligand-binding SRPBCC domain-containing protein